MATPDHIRDRLAAMAATNDDGFMGIVLTMKEHRIQASIYVVDGVDPVNGEKLLAQLVATLKPEPGWTFGDGGTQILDVCLAWLFWSIRLRITLKA